MKTVLAAALLALAALVANREHVLVFSYAGGPVFETPAVVKPAP